jgi:DNA-binding NtrC family response regulator
MTRQTARVLVVDDELPLASLLREFLRGSGHTPELASTGAAALELVSASAPDVVLLDLSLPDTSGEVVLAQLREIQPAVPVIVMTGYDAERAERLLAEGAFATLTKPFNLQHLTSVLDAALASRR